MHDVCGVQELHTAQHVVEDDLEMLHFEVGANDQLAEVLHRSLHDHENTVDLLGFELLFWTKDVEEAREEGGHLVLVLHRLEKLHHLDLAQHLHYTVLVLPHDLDQLNGHVTLGPQALGLDHCPVAAAAEHLADQIFVLVGRLPHRIETQGS